MESNDKKKANHLRIIGGKWRSRQIEFPNVEGLRPTADRVRETLFNWLASDIENANCLDLFSGSGALGFEALSRGAAYVLMFDQSAQVVNQLKKNALMLNADNLDICQASIPANDIKISDKKFNIVFLDPPFHKEYIHKCSEWLDQSQLLQPNALVYIEAENQLFPLPIPLHWRVLRHKKAGQVGYYLIQIE